MIATVQNTRVRRFRFRHGVGLFLLLLFVALLAARIYLPVWLTDYVNKTLNSIPGYRGGVERIDVQLIRGAYTIHGLKLNKLDAGIPVPFIAIDSTDLSLQWGALLRGRIVSDIHLYGPTLNFAKGKSGREQTGKETNWNDPIKKLMPIDINLVEIQRGKLAYRDFDATPAVDLYITDLHGTLNNLRNVEDKNVALPSSLAISGNSIGDGKLKLSGKLNVLTPQVDMDLDAELVNAKLTAINDFSNAYAAIDFKRGELDVYSELAVKNGQVNGYVKPIVRDLSVDRIPDNTNPLHMLWSAAASVLLEIFQNHPNDQFATKVPLTGSLDKIETRFWPTLGGILRNAFIEAFSKGTDNEITFGTMNGAKKRTKENAAPAPSDTTLNPEGRLQGGAVTR